MCALVLTALPLGLYVNVFDFVESPGSTYVSVPALYVHPVSFLKSAGFGLFSDKPNEAVVGFTHASAASPTRIDESEETKEKAEMAKTLLLFLRPLLPLFFFSMVVVLLFFFIEAQILLLSCILKICCEEKFVSFCHQCFFLFFLFFGFDCPLIFFSTGTTVRKHRIISRKKKKTTNKEDKETERIKNTHPAFREQSE